MEQIQRNKKQTNKQIDGKLSLKWFQQDKIELTKIQHNSAFLSSWPLE